MTELPTWAAIGGAISFFILVSGALWGIWWRIEGRVKEARTEVSAQASAAQATASMAREELSAYRTHVAETYVSKAGHREATEQIMDAIQGVKGAVDHLGGRIDTFYSGSPTRPRASK